MRLRCRGLQIRGAGDGHQGFHGIVERPGGGGGGSFVINLLAAAVAYDEAGLLQQPQVMAWGWGFDPAYGKTERSGSHFHFVLGQQF